MCELGEGAHDQDCREGKWAPGAQWSDGFVLKHHHPSFGGPKILKTRLVELGSWLPGQREETSDPKSGGPRWKPLFLTALRPKQVRWTGQVSTGYSLSLPRKVLGAEGRASVSLSSLSGLGGYTSLELSWQCGSYRELVF